MVNGRMKNSDSKQIVCLSVPKRIFHYLDASGFLDWALFWVIEILTHAHTQKQALARAHTTLALTITITITRWHGVQVSDLEAEC